MLPLLHVMVAVGLPLRVQVLYFMLLGFKMVRNFAVWQLSAIITDIANMQVTGRRIQVGAPHNTDLSPLTLHC
jgi:hypothetical protein